MPGTVKVNFNSFRESLTKGKDFKAVTEFPDSLVLDVPANGISNNDLLVSIERLRMIKNAWTLAKTEGEVSQERALAHQSAANALAAEINASSAFKHVQIAATNWQALDFDIAAAESNYEIKKAHAEIADFQRQIAQASVPLEQAKALVQLETVREEFYTAAGQLLQARTDRGVRQQILGMQGYNVGQLPEASLGELPIPQFEFPELQQVEDEIING